jgi:O-antigen/teichoic acid export membrane protein
MIILAIQNISYLYIRKVILLEYSISTVGIYQSAFSISTNYFGLFFAIISTYSLPKLSGIKDPNMIVLEINQMLKLVLLIFVPVLSISYTFRIIILNILYNNDFERAGDLLFYQYLGDLCKSISWIFGLWLLPMLKIKEWLFFDLIYYVNFVAIFLFLLYNFEIGIVSVSISYFIAFLIHALINLFYLKRSLSFMLSSGNIRLLFSSSLAVCAIFLSSHFDISIGYFVLFIVMTIWSFLNITKNDIIALKDLALSAVLKKEST